jgi:NAD(P)-dependent dehydrogenase (short-subunit alcohol dehydrogenase family)
MAVDNHPPVEQHRSVEQHRPVALITGASGIAAATARALAAAGHDLLVLDRNTDNLASLRHEIPTAIAFEADLCTPGAADAAVKAALDGFGRLDVLVNVVGISGRRFGDGPVHECTDEGWRVVMSTNLDTTFHMCRAALIPMMSARGGSIVNVASVLGYAPAGELFATHSYAASKGAIISMSRAMAAYYAAMHIRVNVVAPGLIATPMSTRAQNDAATREYLRIRQPLTGGFGTPDNVAAAIEYLATDRSSFVTGVVLEVAGGWSIAG